MNKVLRIREFAKQLFSTERESDRAGEIIEGILRARSPRMSDIAAAMSASYEANYKRIQCFFN